MLVARVAGVSTREAAEALKGVEIFARRDQLPPPNEDEFYYDDLVGLEAVDADGAPHRPRRVAYELWRRRRSRDRAGPRGRNPASAFTKRVAPRIDFDAGRIVIEPPREVEDED